MGAIEKVCFGRADVKHLFMHSMRLKIHSGASLETSSKTAKQNNNKKRPLKCYNENRFNVKESMCETEGMNS